jgi:hypothetical protein
MATYKANRDIRVLKDDMKPHQQSQGVRLSLALLSQRAAQRLLLAIGTLLSLSLTPAYAVTEPESGEPIIGKSIAATVAGRRIYLSVPFGGEFPLYYQKDGRVDGSGEAVGLGKFLSPTDSGTWWVEDNKLCQKWTRWFEGKVFCFKLEKLPNDKLIWRRDDGEVGVARIGP